MLEKENVVSALKAALTGQMQANNIRIIEDAVVPLKPVKPNKGLYLLWGLFLSLSIGAGYVMMMEALNNKARSRKDIEEDLGFLFLGGVPVLSKIDLTALEALDQDPAAAQAIRNIRTYIGFSGVKQPRSIVVTSLLPGEGKSSILSHLAYAFAKKGEKTLLIDADLYRSHLHKAFGLKSMEPGLSDALASDIPIDRIIRKTAYENLSLIPSGIRTRKSLELIGSDRMKTLLDQLTGRFDRIIIDTPPSFALSEALVLSRLADLTAIVVKADTIDKAALKEMKERFTAYGSKIGGVILNFFDPTLDNRYYHLYSSYCINYSSNIDTKFDGN
jgi:capsular exopolysaccharide synthesis family protein